MGFCHFLLQWTIFCQNSLLWPICLWWPSTVWHISLLSYATPSPWHTVIHEGVYKNRHVISTSSFTYFWIFTHLQFFFFYFFQTLFSTGNGSSFSPCCYNIPTFLSFLLLLLPSFSFYYCMLFPLGFSCGAHKYTLLLEQASRKERRDLLASDFKWSRRSV